MKANRTGSNIIRLALGAGLLASLASCVGPTPAPVVAPPVRPAPVIQRPAPPPAPLVHWRDAPITPGSWEWSNAGGVSSARFAGGILELRCERASGSILLLRAGSAIGPVAMTISTTSSRRTVTAQPFAGPPATIAASFAAHDAMMDAMAFSRGRFALEVQGLAPVFAPNWPEVSRVIEDCR